MHSLDVEFRVLNKRDDEVAADVINTYLSACRMNGQITGKEWTIVYKNKSYIVNLMVPEKNSLSPKNENKYVKNFKKNLIQKGISKPKIISSGKDVESSFTGVLEESDYLILFTNYLSLESPLRSGNTFDPIPLYKIPKTYDNEYYDIICWQSDYQYCDGLQMGCKTGERFGTRELTDFKSSLSKRGLEICKNISKLVNKPCYYYLYKGNGRTAKSEAERVCPICGNKKWKLKETHHSLIDFKCDKCKVVSNVAWTLTYP